MLTRYNPAVPTPLDYESPKRKLSKSPALSTYAFSYAGVLMIVNIVLVLFALSDRGWGALGIAVIIGPITNGVCALVGGLAGVLMELPMRIIPICIMLSAGFVILDFALMLAMPMSGC